MTIGDIIDKMKNVQELEYELKRLQDQNDPYLEYKIKDLEKLIGIYRSEDIK